MKSFKWRYLFSGGIILLLFSLIYLSGVNFRASSVNSVSRKNFNDKINKFNYSTYNKTSNGFNNNNELNTSNINKDSQGSISISKKASINNDNNRSVHVKLSVRGNQYTIADKADIVLILDRSSSMNGNSMDSVKESATNLINDITTDNTMVGVVSYGSDLLSEYSSDSLSSNKEYLKGIVNSIPSVLDGQGTNISVAAEAALGMLNNSKRDVAKIIILLSDGAPTFYSDKDNVLCGTGFDNSYDNRFECGATPRDKTTSIINNIKNNKVSFYTIGFGLGSSGDDYNYLKTLASCDKYSYSADNYKELEKSFKNIFSPRTVVAKDGVIVDSIGEGFHLRDDSLPSGAITTDNGDGTKTITWNVGNITNKEISLEYDLIADDKHYGSMYTNKKATLDAISTDGNPEYGSNKKVELEFEKPIVLIPPITNNDTYTIEHGRVYDSGDNSILNNDNLGVLHNDGGNNITDNIELVYDNDTNGRDGDIDINNNGSFKYRAGNKTDTIIYKYYVKEAITGTDKVVQSNVSTITLNVVNTTEYKVNYIEKSTNNKIANSKRVNNITSNKDIYSHDEIINIDGYKFIVADTEVINTGGDNNTINLYYEPIYGTVKSVYVDKGDKELAKPDVTKGRATTKYKTNAKDINNYNLIDTIGNESGKYTDSETRVTYVYEKREGIPNTGINIITKSPPITLMFVLLIVGTIRWISLIIIKRIKD